MPSGSDYDGLIRQIRSLVRALAVIVAGGRVVAAPALPIPRVEEPDPLQRWFVRGVLAALAVCVLAVSTHDYLERARWQRAWEERCGNPQVYRCSSFSYTIWEQKQGFPPPPYRHISRP